MDFIKRIFKEQAPPNKYYVAICCIVKDENSYLAEWMDYHLKIGVEHFYIYDNGSKVAIADTIRNIGLSDYATVTKINGKAKQVKAYSDCLKKMGNNAQWIAFTDTDEFIVAKTLNGNLAAFLKNFEPFGGLGVNWQVFGSSGHLNRTHKSQIESFSMRAEENFHVNKHIKCIVQPMYVQSVENSHSFNFKDGRFCVNENFEKITGTFADVYVKKIQLNHYYCRSLEEYKEKIERGLGDTRRKRTMDEFYQHDNECNKVKDTEIIKIVQSIKEQ